MSKYYLTNIILLIFSLSAYSETGNVQGAKITSVYCGYFDERNMCSMEFDKAIDDRDECNTIIANRMQFKVDTEIGKSILSIALVAHSTQKSVKVYSTGLCDVYGGLSDVNYIEIIN